MTTKEPGNPLWALFLIVFWGAVALTMIAIFLGGYAS